MDRFPRIVIGYHGCEKDFANNLISGSASILDWKQSQNAYDWLGSGVYFWEHGPERALRWARDNFRDNGAVVGAAIQLGQCLDLTDIRYTGFLAQNYKLLKSDFERESRKLPVNGDGADRDDLRKRHLDCAVINYAFEVAGAGFQTVRSPFWEGPEAFEGSWFRAQTHIQIAVRDRGCILGVFRPHL